MALDIIKDLKAQTSRRKKINEQNEVLKEVKGLLEYDEQRDAQIMNLVGSQSTFAKSQEEKGRMLELERKEKFYSGTIFHISDILKLAASYRLKLLPSSLYKSYIDAAVVPEIKALERNMSKSMMAERAVRENKTLEEYLAIKPSIDYKFDDNQLKTQFYILAPAECFKIDKKRAFNIKLPSLDPVMFYSDDQIHFRLIKKWGTDFTVARRIKGLLNRNEDTWRFFILMLPFTLAVLAASYLFSPWVLCALALNFLISIIGNFKEDTFGESYVRSHTRY